MEVDSAVRDHQQTNQQASEEVESHLAHCEAAANNNNPEDDTEPVNQTDTGEEVNLKSSKTSPQDNQEDQAPVSQNGHGEVLQESPGDNCANDCDEQIDVVNSDHDEIEVKPTENNAEENDKPSIAEETGEDEDNSGPDPGPVEGNNEIPDQEMTNETHEENHSRESDVNTPAEKECPNSEEDSEVSELILEKVEGESRADEDNNQKSSVQHDEDAEMVVGKEDTAERDNHQVEGEHVMDVADETEKKETNSEPSTATKEKSEEDDNTSKEREENKEEATHEECSEHLTVTTEKEEKEVDSNTENRDEEGDFVIENGEEGVEDKIGEGDDVEEGNTENGEEGVEDKTEERGDNEKEKKEDENNIETGEKEMEGTGESGDDVQDQESSEPTPVSTENSESVEENLNKDNQEKNDETITQDHETTPDIDEVEEEKTMEVDDEVAHDSDIGATEVEEKEISSEADESSTEKEEEEEDAEAIGNLDEMEDEILSLNSSQPESNCANDISRQSSRVEGTVPSQTQGNSLSSHFSDLHKYLLADDREGDRDQLEENLECILPPEPEKETDVSEQVLVDDDDMVVTQITSIDELEVSHETNGHSQILQKPKTEDNGQEEAANIDQFTEVEDLIIHALDTVSPFDAKFISDHMPGRDEQQIERRLTDHSFRKLSFSFQKLPFLMFEMIFIGEHNERSSSLMLLTQKSLLQLKNKHGWCDTSYNLEVLELRYNSKTRFGIDVGALCEFIITNIPSIHMPYLRRNVREIEAFLEASNINYRKPNVKRDLKQLLNKVQQEVTMESLRLEGKQPIRIDEEGDLHFTDDHEDMLRKIVANVGINHWEEVTKLLLAVFEYDVDIDLDDDEIYDKIKCYYESKLDPNLSSGFFTEDEDKCIIFMYKYWSKIMEDDQIWKQISQHLVGRSANQVKNRFLRTSQSPLDLTLENIVKYPDDKSNPATFNTDMAHMFSLTVVQKNLATDLEITSKLQHETRYLVLGTCKEMFILPCKDFAIRPHHPGVVQHTFTYDPSRPPQQFVTFVKLTFGNGLKKLGLLDDPDRFNFNDIELHSPSIHQMMEEADRERSVSSFIRSY